MKSILIILFAVLALVSILPAQVPVIKERIKLDPALMNRDVRYKVINQVNDTSSRIKKAGDFKLAPTEKKAVGIIQEEVIRFDKSVVANLPEVSNLTDVYALPEKNTVKTAGQGKDLSYIILIIDSAPMKYDPGENFFRGKIRILPVVMDDGTNPPSGQIPLETPEDIIVSYGTESVPLQIRNVNWPPLDVTVSEANPRDSLKIKVLTASKPLGYPINLRIEPAIMLSSTRATIQGLGIQTLPVHVSLKGVTSYRPVPLTVESSLGSLDEANMTLADDEPKSVMLRSEGLGRIDLRVINSNYVSNTISIEAVFPWLFLILALAGGLIAAVAYWGLGIVLIGFSVETRGLNEAMVFGFGLLAGYFGLKMINK